MPEEGGKAVSTGRRRRAPLAMSDREVEELLGGRHTMVLATVGPTGRTHLVAVWYGFVERAPAFLTYRRAQKLRNIGRDPRVTCLVETGDSYDELRGVQLAGRAEVVTDEASRLAAAWNITERYEGPLDDGGRARVADAIVKRVVVRVRVEDVVSWDHRKLQAGAPPATTEVAR